MKIYNINLNDIIKNVLTCGECDEQFALNWKLEKHLRTHAASTVYKCKECNKTFYLEWRLKQHMKAHGSSSFKFCHYFNNYRTCPYEEIGCMFNHQHSSQCKYKENCSNKLCQFKHDRQTIYV